MKRSFLLSLLALSMIPLGGCAVGIAASAVGLAVRGAQGEPESNAHLQPAAAEACSAQAAQYGTVHIIDVEQRSTDRIVVWGTVTNGDGRRSFECRYGTEILGFKLREIAARSPGGAS